jgi:hypothetical protein
MILTLFLNVLEEYEMALIYSICLGYKGEQNFTRITTQFS